MFLTEKDLKDSFWKNYNYAHRAVRYQFDCPLRDRETDLITVEKFQNNVQFNSFEFMLNDVKRVILQAKSNIPYVHKSWIVMPDEKERLLTEKYMPALIKEQYIGVITVDEGGHWTAIYKPKFNNEVMLNQAILNLLI